LVLVLSILFGVAVKGCLSPSAGFTNSTTQDSVFLDRRISLLETRLSTIESSLRNLEQQAMNSQRSSQVQPARDPETVIIRTDIETLNVRMTMLECGLVQLDERTLSASAKEARKRTSAQPMDPCRLNPETPIPLTPRR
jgi:hypothetical protein